MAKRTKETATEVKPEPVTDEQILGSFLSRRDAAEAEYDAVKADFLSRVASDPADAIAWRAEDVVKAQAGWREWKRYASGFDVGDWSLIERFSAIVEKVSKELDDFTELRSWEKTSNSAMANGANIAAVSGRVKALRDIRMHAQVALMKLEERDGGSDR